MLRFGPDEGPVVIVALPLFEEANRTRAFAVTICRALAARGVASALPDLPGTGESLVALETVNILDMQSAYEGVIAHIERDRRPCFGVGVRSGALLDAYGLLFGRWHLAPQSGAELLRDLTRIKQIEVGNAHTLSDLWYFDTALSDDETDPPVEIAGNLISIALLTDLSVKTSFAGADIPLRTIRLESDPRPAIVKFAGSPLWRRAEPGNDPALAALLAGDIVDWIAKCGA